MTITVEASAEDAAASRLAAAIAGQQAYELARRSPPPPLTEAEHEAARRLAAQDQARFELECQAASAAQTNARVAFTDDPGQLGMLPTIAGQRAAIAVTKVVDSYKKLEPAATARIIEALEIFGNSGQVGRPRPWFNPSDGEIVPERVLAYAPSSDHRRCLLEYPFDYDATTAPLVLSQVRWARNRPIVWVRPGASEPE